MITNGNEVTLNFSNGTYFIWDIEVIKFVRKKYRIIGNFFGTPLLKNVSSFQNKIKSLPLKLSNEEAYFLIENNAEVYNYNVNTEKDFEECLSQFKSFHEKFLDSYKEDFLNFKKNIINSKLEEIIKKKVEKKNIQNVDVDEILNEELKKCLESHKINHPVQQIIETPYRVFLKKQTENLLNLSKDLKYLVYKDLNNKGLYLTEGSKFGCDYLAYNIDPLFCHASYLVVCLYDKNIYRTKMHTYSRLASQVNKSVIVVRLKEENSIELEYMVFKWQV